MANVKFIQNNSTKVRPVLAVSLDVVGDGDIVILPISSSDARTDFDIEVSVHEGTGLSIFPSYIRTAKPLTVEKKALFRKIGELDEVDLANALEKLRSLF